MEEVSQPAQSDPGAHDDFSGRERRGRGLPQSTAGSSYLSPPRLSVDFWALRPGELPAASDRPTHDLKKAGRKAVLAALRVCPCGSCQLPVCGLCFLFFCSRLDGRVPCCRSAASIAGPSVHIRRSGSAQDGRVGHLRREQRSVRGRGPAPASMTRRRSGRGSTSPRANVFVKAGSTWTEGQLRHA